MAEITLAPALAEVAQILDAIKSDVESGKMDVVDARSLLARWSASWALAYGYGATGRPTVWPRWSTQATYSATAGATVSPVAAGWRVRVYCADGSLQREMFAATEEEGRAMADQEMGVGRE